MVCNQDYSCSGEDRSSPVASAYCVYKSSRRPEALFSGVVVVTQKSICFMASTVQTAPPIRVEKTG